jgi:hypothetical protein
MHLWVRPIIRRAKRRAELTVCRTTIIGAGALLTGIRIFFSVTDNLRVDAGSVIGFKSNRRLQPEAFGGADTQPVNTLMALYSSF